MQHKYCGYITIVGKSNVGKSTLLNQIIGKTISIASRKKNTTQNNIIGIHTDNEYQSIYIDTPGILCDAQKHNIKYIKKIFPKIAKNTTLIMFIIDQIYWTEEDEIILKSIKKNKIPIIVIINKIDKISNKIILLPFINFLKKKVKPIEIIPISAKKINNITILKNIMYSYLPKMPHIYPPNYITTNSTFFTISEIIRKQLILFLGDELPSILKVEIESLYNNQKGETYIKGIILVDNIRQKKIVIGQNGHKIKQISMISRNNIEKEMKIKVHLLLWIKQKHLKK